MKTVAGFRSSIRVSNTGWRKFDACNFYRSAVNTRSWHSKKKIGRIKKRATITTCQSGPSDVFVLDLDGVLVDSAPEISRVGIKAARKIFPEAAEKLPEASFDALSKKMHALRPLMTKGFEDIIMARLLAEDLANEDKIKKDWISIRDAKLSEWDWTPDALQEAFMAERNAWIGNHLSDWMAFNQPFPGVKEILQYCEFPFYIVTSKPASSASAVLQNVFELDIPEDSPRLFGDRTPPEVGKASALKEIAERPICKDTKARLHFVDDRFETLKSLLESGDFGNWNFYLAEWGYNSPEAVTAAKSMGLKTLSLHNFCELLKWGILMGVDDGCEPTPDEVIEQVYDAKSN